MKEDAYKKIIAHYENCLNTHGDTHLGMDWPNISDAQKRYGIMLDLMRFKKESQEVSLLDFGCGTSHLYQYMLEHTFSKVTYSGLDITKKFVNLAQEKYPENTYYQLDVLKDASKLPSFDYIVCNGVFTEKRELTFEAMWAYMQQLLLVLFNKADKGIAFNVMSKAVDWERWDLFHLSTDLLIDFMTKQLSRNFIIRNDYGLYEYTVYIYK
ncbi:class I SAM-dependent methyltransferase [Xanthomarina sp. GH4-25]|uniref:class I SAM-dependent methyltransferase n=1 Tax=Xanthomarina sp. GH4-25 TaxID=3349335 RepID=UPI003877B4E3